MIEINRTGYCIGCEYADLDLKKLYHGRKMVVEVVATCRHEDACRRVYMLGLENNLNDKSDLTIAERRIE